MTAAEKIRNYKQVSIVLNSILEKYEVSCNRDELLDRFVGFRNEIEDLARTFENLAHYNELWKNDIL